MQFCNPCGMGILRVCRLFVRDGFILLSPGVYKSRATTFCPVTPNMHGCSEWNLLLVSILAAGMFGSCICGKKNLTPGYQLF
jgi:hypothetical protein